MNVVNGNIKKIYLKYLFAAFGSSLISCIYGLVDMAMVGQYYGPIGSQAMAIIAPIWNIIYSLGLLIGIGGSVLFAVNKGKNDKTTANKFFTASIVYGAIMSIVFLILFWLFEDQLLYVFGAKDANTLKLCKEYLLPIKFAAPSFIFAQILAAYLRNDNKPMLATLSIIFAGVFNVAGDYIFVFSLDMGMLGAGLATAIGSLVSLLIMSTHFFSKSNTMKFLCNKEVFSLFVPISKTGFSAFIADIAMGFLTMLFNNLILKYLNDDALAVYAVIINISTIVQCCGYGIGQAGQPILSTNFGAKQYDRVSLTLKYNIITAIVVGTIWMGIVTIFPKQLIRIFMVPTEEVLNIAPNIMRVYSISFLILPFNVYCTYYFQALLKENVATFISLARGIVISGIVLILLPLIFGGNAMWWTMVITEALVAIYAVLLMIKLQRKLRIEKINTK